MKLASALLFFSVFAAWGQDSESPETLEVSDAAPAAEPAPDESAQETPAPWKLSIDTAVRSTIVIPVWKSYGSFRPGLGLGAEIAVPLPDKRWHVRSGLDVMTTSLAGQKYYLTSLRPGVAYDAFFGPTAFMSFEAEAGWLAATTPDGSFADNKPCAGIGTAVAFYLGDHVQFRTDLRYLEVFGAFHAVTFGLGFDVIGN